MTDVLVIGAGPAGTTTARLCAQAGLEVMVLEEHDEVGNPVHCTGIVGREFLDTFAIPRHLVLNDVSRFRIHAPSGRHFDLPSRQEAAAHVLDRRALDVYLADLARSEGVEIHAGTRATSVEQDADGVTVRAVRAGEDAVYRGEVCVLACGAMSNLPYRSGILPPRAFYRTVQGRCRVRGLVGAEIYLGRRVAPGSFAYAVDVGEGEARVGVITHKPTRGEYQRLLEETGLADRVYEGLGEMHRRIPMGSSRRTVVGRVCAVGDVAGQCKTTTGGGLYYAMLCARILGEALAGARGTLCVDRLQAYERTWRRRIGREIQAGLWWRGFFEHVGDAEVDRLVAAASSPGVQSLLQREWHFDFHGRLLAALVASPELRSHALYVAGRTLRTRRMLDFILGSFTSRLPVGWFSGTRFGSS